IWTTSGLENPLLAALAAASCALTMRAEAAGPALAALAGVSAALLALTRPDATLYSCAFPLVLLWTTRPLRTLRWRALLAYGFGCIPVLAGYAVFRRLSFGAWVPNTYYAKGRPELAFLLDVDKWISLGGTALGVLGLPLLALAVFSRWRGELRRERD